MFGSIDKSKGLLFVTHDLDQTLRNTVQGVWKEVEAMEATTHAARIPW
jgi:mannose/cellobiose epimerase-like protein (N-acyl-D-glucosamine 2-epimerase family)